MFVPWTGINLVPTFSRRISHLLCPSKTGPKYDKAREWNIPVVDMSWLAGVVSSGRFETTDVNTSPFTRQENDTGDRPLDQPVETRVAEEKTNTPVEDGKCYFHTVRSPAHQIKGILPQIQDQFDQHSTPQRSRTDDTRDLEEEPFGEPIRLLQDNPKPTSLPDANCKTTELPDTSCVESGSTGHAMSLAELREDMQNTRIPSSASPSPIGTPSSTSPAKISREATKVLQESITSLLGKRISTGDLESGHTSRPKRPRPPPRIKVCHRLLTRSIGLTKINQRQEVEAAPDSHNSAENPTRSPFEPFIASEEAVSMLAAERAQLEDTVRVTYEDPVQNDEKLRLMKLLETQKPKEIWESDPRSSRNAEEKNSRRKRPRRRGAGS